MQRDREVLRRKNIIYSVVLLFFVGSVYVYRNYLNVEQNSLKEGFVEIYNQGVTMGVVQYNIKYLAEEGTDHQPAIDSLLAAFNQSLSTYVPNSEISTFNQAGTDSITFTSSFFFPVLKESEEVYQKTNGAFDPTVMPLVNAWGFGPDGEPVLNEQSIKAIDSLLSFVGFEKLDFNNTGVSKKVKGVQLDFSAIAKGYAVDLVADLLEKRDIKNYLVEIGGEMVCSGKNAKGEFWLIGIDNPRYLEQGGEVLSAKIKIENRALATSGNYRNYYIKDGKRYAHTISPKTGMPVQHNLLSASVFSKNCMRADAFATAFMAMGTEEAKKILDSEKDLEAILIYEEEGDLKNYISPSLLSYIQE